MKLAKDANAYLDLTYGRSLKSLLLLDDGGVVGCGITPKTMLARFSSGITAGETDCNSTEGTDIDEEILEESEEGR